MSSHALKCMINMAFLQTGIEPQFILFFDCPEEEMERRLLGRNQVWFLHVALWIIIVCKLLIMVVNSWKVYSICIVSYVVLLTSWPWKNQQGRVDDNIETIRKRFKVFVDSSLPVVDYYEKQDKVHKVNWLPRNCFFNTLESSSEFAFAQCC